MPRIFIHHDKEGKVLGVVSVETVAEGREHPFHLANEEHGVVELPADDPAHGGDLLDVLNRRIAVESDEVPAPPDTGPAPAAKTKPRGKNR